MKQAFLFNSVTVARLCCLSAGTAFGAGLCQAQNSSDEKEKSAAPASATTATAAEPPLSADKLPWLIPYTDYKGDLAERAALTGDWGGFRQSMMDKGLRFDISACNVLQGNVSGGIDNDLSASGVLDIGGKLDTNNAGLWPGGILSVKAQASYGENHNKSVGSLIPVNFGALYPQPGEDTLQVVELSYTQFLSTWIAVTFGKFSLRDANVFAHDETEQFLNTAFNINPVAGTTVPLTCLGAGVILIPVEGLTISTLFLDSEGTARQSGFDTAFRRGTTTMQSWELTIKPFKLTGHQRITWTYSDRSRVQFTQDPHALAEALLEGNLGALQRKSTDWCAFYDFDQYIYEVPGAPGRGIGFFGRAGVGDNEVNINQFFWSAGLGAKGPFDSRPNDSFGAAFYYDTISNELPRIVQNRSDNEKGIEIYYNFAVTPWLHITPDLQVIDPARSKNDTTVVAGLRARIIF